MGTSSQVKGTSGSGGLRIGRYELMTKIAVGGMGEIFIARLAGEAPVALKLLLPHLCDDVEFVRMFLDEARLVARMHHPNIVEVRDLGQSDGRYFIAMALVEGVSLSTLLQSCRARHAPLPLPVVRRIAVGLCAGLAYAHRLLDEHGRPIGVVHRDVTPHNILLSRTGDVCLTDFGIAKAQGSLHRTRFGVVRGKFAYVAPEQLERGRPVDARADLYAAGVTLFEALTLVSPFARETYLEIVEAVKSDALPDARPLRPDIPAELVHALEQGTRKNPSERFSSADAFGEPWRQGEVDDGSELGRWVTEMCGDALRPFRGEPASEPIQGTQSLVDPADSVETQSLVDSIETQSLLDSVQTRRPTRSSTDKAAKRRPRWQGLASVALCTGFFAALLIFWSLHHFTRQRAAVAPDPRRMTPPAIRSAPPSAFTPEPIKPSPALEPSDRR